MKLTLPGTLQQYEELGRYLNGIAEDEPDKWRAWMRAYSRASIYFLLRFVLSTRNARLPDGSELLVRHQWWLDRCNDVQRERNNVIDIWAREHGKSTIKTFADNIRLALINPEIAICIFSVKKRLAKHHLTKIRVELEQNEMLKMLFPDIIWEEPKDAPVWSVDDGLVLKRQSNRLEATFRSSGYLSVVDVGAHYDVIDCDDLVDREVATSARLSERSKEKFSEIVNLTTRSAMLSVTGTYYSDSDLHRHLEDEGIVEKTRIFPAWDKSVPRPDLRDIGGGEPVLLTPEELRVKKKRQGAAWFWVQMGCDPRGAENAMLPWRQIQRYKKHPFKAAEGGNLYLFCDPGGGRTDQAKADPTAFMAVVLQGDENIYILDMVKKRMAPSERCRFAIDFWAKWSEWAEFQEFRWEEAGTGSDVHHLERLQAKENRRFRITRVPRGGVMKHAGEKMRRDDYYYAKLEPVISENRIWVPDKLTGQLMDNPAGDLTKDFLLEVERFPIAKQDHLMSCLVMLFEEPASTKTKTIPHLVWPAPTRRRRSRRDDEWGEEVGEDEGTSWMAA